MSCLNLNTKKKNEKKGGEQTTAGVQIREPIRWKKNSITRRKQGRNPLICTVKRDKGQIMEHCWATRVAGKIRWNLKKELPSPGEHGEAEGRDDRPSVREISKNGEAGN